ncbi:hypothetical protein QTN27_23365, partial [Escherichia coli]|uniref:hypothetical protein n=1 Tax=Escherichia coli TaxID=562 RepID=UPI0027425452
HTNRPLTDFGGKTSIFSHPVYLFLREFSLQDFRGGSSFILADKFITQFSANQQVRLNLQEFPGRGGLILS